LFNYFLKILNKTSPSPQNIGLKMYKAL